MPNLFRSLDGKVWKPGDHVPLELADETHVEGIWAGSAREEKLEWWLSKPGCQLAESEKVAEIAIKAEDTKEILWAAAPAGARLLFLLEAPPPGKDYRLARMVTTASTPAQAAHFRHDRFSLFGKLDPDGSIEKIPPSEPPPSAPKTQGELF